MHKLTPVLLLVGSNLFMTYAWYGHLKDLRYKVIQEVITMIVFAGFCTFYMKQRLSLDYLWAALCLVAAAYFMFRDVRPAT